MSLTRLEMVNEVLDTVNRSSAATTRSGVTLSDMAVRWLNRAQRQLARRYDMLFKTSTASTVASQQTYAFPDTLRAVFSVKLEDGLNSRKLKCVMPWAFDKRVPKPDEDTEERPTYYIPYKASNQFDLYRIPDDAYTLRMRHSSWPADLSSDSSVSDYWDAYIDVDDVLITLAVAAAFRFYQELIDARDWNKRGWEAARAVWLAERESFPDWAPSGEDPMYAEVSLTGEYYNNPFMRSSP